MIKDYVNEIKEAYDGLKETYEDTGVALTLFLVHGNTYYNGYGHNEHCFGVFTQRDMAENARDMVVKELFEKELKNEFTYIDDITDIDVDILEIESDKSINKCLGGYCE